MPELHLSRYICALAVVAAVAGCGGSTTGPATLPDGSYMLRVEEPTLGSARDTIAIRVSSGLVTVNGASIAANVGLQSFAGASACSGKPRSCWAGSWTGGTGYPLTVSGSSALTSLTLAFQSVILFSPAPPAPHTYSFASPYTVAYDSSSAGVYELRRQ